MDNYYEILQVPTDAPLKVIRESYRRLAITLHPDKNKALDATEAFQRVNRAWEVLKDESQRVPYDIILFEELRRAPPKEENEKCTNDEMTMLQRRSKMSNHTTFEEFDFNSENYSYKTKSSFHADSFDPRSFTHPSGERSQPSCQSSLPRERPPPPPPAPSQDEMEIAAMEMELRILNDEYEPKLCSVMGKIGRQDRKERGSDMDEDRLRYVAEAGWEMASMRLRAGVLKEEIKKKIEVRVRKFDTSNPHTKINGFGKDQQTFSSGW